MELQREGELAASTGIPFSAPSAMLAVPTHCPVVGACPPLWTETLETMSQRKQPLFPGRCVLIATRKWLAPWKKHNCCIKAQLLSATEKCLGTSRQKKEAQVGLLWSPGRSPRAVGHDRATASTMWWLQRVQPPFLELSQDGPLHTGHSITGVKEMNEEHAAEHQSGLSSPQTAATAKQKFPGSNSFPPSLPVTAGHTTGS